MGNYAKVENGIVTEVIRADGAFIAGLIDKDKYIKTSYNTMVGHRIGGGKQVVTAYDNKEPLRCKFAGIGDTYDTEADEFRPVKPYASWVWNKTMKCWEPPVPKPTVPTNHYCVWNDSTGQWLIREVDNDPAVGLPDLTGGCSIQTGSAVIEYVPNKKYPHLHESSAYPKRLFNLQDGTFWEEVEGKLKCVGPKTEPIPPPPPQPEIVIPDADAPDESMNEPDPLLQEPV